MLAKAESDSDAVNVVVAVEDTSLRGIENLVLALLSLIKPQSVINADNGTVVEIADDAMVRIGLLQ